MPPGERQVVHPDRATLVHPGACAPCTITGSGGDCGDPSAGHRFPPKGRGGVGGFFVAIEGWEHSSQSLRDFQKTQKSRYLCELSRFLNVSV